MSPHAQTPGLVDRAAPRWRALRDLVQAKAIITGDFTLSSGRKSTYMFQLRAVTLLPEGQYLIGNLILDAMKRLNIACVSGMELGAVPIVTAVAFASHLAGHPVHASFVRKEAKTHGARERINGEAPTGADVLVVDDVTTTGSSILKAAEVLRSERGCRVPWALAVVDREEGAAESLAQAGLGFIALFKKSDFRIA